MRMTGRICIQVWVVRFEKGCAPTFHIVRIAGAICFFSCIRRGVVLFTFHACIYCLRMFFSTSRAADVAVSYDATTTHQSSATGLR